MFLRQIVRNRVPVTRSIPLDVFSYSGNTAVPEQAASIRSFLRHAGRPKTFTVVSDGSHSPRNVRLLQQIDPSVRVQPSPPLPSPDLPEKFREYLKTHPTGKQLAIIMSLPVNGPSLYLDSDVLFFDAAADLVDRIAEPNVSAFYLADCQFSGDSRLLLDSAEKNRPVNTGVLLLFRKIDWSLARERFQMLETAPIFFTNQTLVHLVLHAAGARPFDPAKYLLRLDDQFVHADRYAGPTLVLRHYVNPVRHKFWTSH